LVEKNIKNSVFGGLTKRGKVTTLVEAVRELKLVTLRDQELVTAEWVKREETVVYARGGKSVTRGGKTSLTKPTWETNSSVVGSSKDCRVSDPEDGVG